MNVVQNTYPEITAYPIGQIKSDLRVDGDGEDLLIYSLLKAATSMIEGYTNRVLLESTFTAYLDELPSDLTVYLFKYPVTSIDSVKYYNSSGVLTTLTNNVDYFIDISGCPARVKFLTPPSVQANILNGIQINFTGGATDINSVDKGIIAALRVIVGHLYENRQGDNIDSLPFNRILNQYIVGSLWT